MRNPVFHRNRDSLTIVIAQGKRKKHSWKDTQLLSLPAELLPSPFIPQLPFEQLTRWLRVQECEAYLTPLYQRGWYVSSERLPNGKQRTFLTLKRDFTLRKRVWAAAFMKQVADAMIARKVSSVDSKPCQI